MKSERHTAGDSRAQLIVRPAHGASRQVPLDRDRTTIGRSAECDVVLDFSYISRVHARIERDGASYLLLDDESTNGTFVNGARIAHVRALTSGDHIAIGDVSMTFLDSATAADGRTLSLPSDCPVRCDPVTRELWMGAEKVSGRLSAQEFQLVGLLLTEYGRVCPRDALAMSIWGPGNYDYNMLHRLVHRLKQKLEGRHDLVQTVAGVGYAFAVTDNA